jgi:hypothetical protein
MMFSSHAIDPSPSSQISTGKLSLNRAFDDALDALEITYDTYYEIDLHRPRCLHILAWLLTNGIRKGDVLVIGPFPYPLTMLLQKIGFSVEEMRVRHGRETLEDEQNQERLPDLQDLFDSPKMYDVIICDDLLQYLVFPVTILQTLNKRLSPDGTIIMGTPNVGRGSTRLRLLFGKNIYPWLSDDMLDDNSSGKNTLQLIPYREYTVREAETLVLSAGFTVLHRQYLIGKKTINNNSAMSVRTYLLLKIYSLIQKMVPSLRSHFLLAMRKKSCKNMRGNGEKRDSLPLKGRH